MVSKTWIPEVSEERIHELAQRIKPVVRMARVKTSYRHHSDGSMSVIHRRHKRGKWRTWPNGKLFNLKSVDLFDIAYTWDPQPTRPPEKATGLHPLCEITTYHTYGYHGMFKPSIAEVIA